MIHIWLLIAAIALSGCSGIKPLKGGSSRVKLPPVSYIKEGSTSGQMATVDLVQPENPLTPATQTIERTTETMPSPVSATNAPVVTKTTEKISTTIGAAQKDTSRELSARLNSVRPIQWVGVCLILAALAMFHPVVAAVTLSRTLQAVTGATGLALVVLPTLVASRPGLFSAAALAGIAIPLVWFIAHRHGSKGVLPPPQPAPDKT